MPPNLLLKGQKKAKKILLRKEKEAHHQNASSHTCQRFTDTQNEFFKRQETRFQALQRIKTSAVERDAGARRYRIPGHSKDTSKFEYSTQEKKKNQAFKRRKEAQSCTLFQKNFRRACDRKAEKI